MDETEVKEAAGRLKNEVKGAAETVATEVATKAVDAAKTEFKAATEKLAADLKTVAEQADRLDVASQRGGWNGNDPAKDGGMGTIRKALEDNATKLKEFANAGKGRRSVVITDIKATITTGNVTAAGAAGVIAPMRLPGIITPPSRPQHVRDFIATGTTTSNQVVYVRESSYTDGTGITGEGQLKPNSSLTLETKIAPVVKIANYFKISEEMLQDIPQLMSYIGERSTYKLLLVEDAQLLNGSGTGTNMNGIRTQATAFTGGNIRVPAPNDFDVIRSAVSQIRQLEYQADVVLMNPEDVARMELTKTTFNSYVLPSMLTGIPTTLAGVSVLENTTIAPGNFLVGAFKMGAQIFFREGINIRVYDQNEDDAIHNLVTVVIEERLALCVYRPDAFVTGTFATAITAITAS